MLKGELESVEGWRTLLKRQEEAEAIAMSDGEKAFREAISKDAQKGNMAQNAVGRLLVKQGLEPLESALEEWKTEQSGRRLQHRTATYTWLKDKLDTATAAYITLKVVLDSVCKRQKYTETCSRIADLIVDELRYRRLKEKAPALFDYKLRNFETSSYAHMAKSLNFSVKNALDEHGDHIDVSDLKLSPHLRLQLGAKMVELLVASTGLVLVSYERPLHAKHKVQRMTAYLEATPETHAWLTQRTDAVASSIMEAYTRPMLMPPRPWGKERRGGYRFAQRKKYPLVRGQWDREWGRHVEQQDMPLVYGALNTMQETAWQVNTSVLDLLGKIHEAGGGYAGLPTTEPLPLPPKPQDIDTNLVARKLWRRAAHDVHAANLKRRVRWREVTRLLNQAEKLRNEDAFFFAYAVDFRGRVYPWSDYLQPQGDDMSRSLLLLADRKSVDPTARKWLAVHGANCLDEVPEGKMSKMPFEERVAWIESHTKDILQVAHDPLADLWWTSADQPLQFYAFCVEWARLAADPTYQSGLPVMMDGSCNGLQHFSALLRDEVGGKAVNLVPSARPNDVYAEVAEAVKDKLEACTGKDAELAIPALAMGLVTRKLCKRPTMTFGYGSKRFGFENQIDEYLHGLDNWQEIKKTFGQKQVRPLARLLARLIWESLGDVVTKAQEGMQWLQQCAVGVAAANRAVQWEVPFTEFPARQDYMVTKSVDVATVLAGKTMRPRIVTATADVDRIKQRNAVAPNIIHSFDAACLMLTVELAHKAGVEAFAMVHDSYGTVPADVERMMLACRMTFVQFYTEREVLMTLYQQLASQWTEPEKCPPPPAFGTLEVRQVLQSSYFFA